MATSSLLMVTVKGRRGVNCGFSSSALNESGFLPGKDKHTPNYVWCPGSLTLHLFPPFWVFLY